MDQDEVTTIYHEPLWRASYWDEHVPSRPAWFVTCADHPEVGRSTGGEPWGYAALGSARSVRTRHLNTAHASRP